MRSMLLMGLLLLGGMLSLQAQSFQLPRCIDRPGTVTLPRINYNYYCLETITQTEAGRPFAYIALAFAPDGTLYATRPLQGQLIALT
ncbi:MAG: hypothetical protein KC615_24605, partial [Anaerolineae bacterium]|nr:hypothetical protein [Anaerolineae bacterium]